MPPSCSIVASDQDLTKRYQQYLLQPHVGLPVEGCVRKRQDMPVIHSVTSARAAQVMQLG